MYHLAIVLFSSAFFVLGGILGASACETWWRHYAISVHLAHYSPENGDFTLDKNSCH